jgi:hypothetical protein
MKKLISSENISRAQMLSLTKELNVIKNEIALARTNHKMDVYEILDNNQKKIWMEQRKGFERMKDKIKNRKKERIHEQMN